MSFTGLIRRILEAHPEGMTPQQIRDTVKSDYLEFYGTESHVRNVEKGHYQDLDHALLAQIYSVSRTGRQINVDKTQKPIRMSLGPKKISNDTGREWAPVSNNKNRTRVARRAIVKTHAITPSSEVISDYFKKWEKLENYRLQETSLGLLFHSLCPENENIEHVLLKVSALNDFYSTHIFDTYSVAKHIVSKAIDSRLDAIDYSLVNDIAVVSIRGKTKNLYSFASKYCSHHKPEHYPVFDSFVEKMLLHYKKADHFEEFGRLELKNYESFIEIIEAFQSFYRLENCSLREIDIFLWLAGKEFFPRKYK